MVFFLVGSGNSLFLVDFVVLQTVMVIFFLECTFPPLVEIGENPEFHDLMRVRLIGPDVYSGMAGFLCFRVLMVPLLGLLMLLRVLFFWLRSLLDVIRLG